MLSNISFAVMFVVKVSMAIVKMVCNSVRANLYIRRHNLPQVDTFMGIPVLLDETNGLSNMLMQCSTTMLLMSCGNKRIVVTGEDYKSCSENMLKSIYAHEYGHTVARGGIDWWLAIFTMAGMVDYSRPGIQHRLDNQEMAADGWAKAHGYGRDLRVHLIRILHAVNPSQDSFFYNHMKKRIDALH